MDATHSHKQRSRPHSSNAWSYASTAAVAHCVAASCQIANVPGHGTWQYYQTKRRGREGENKDTATQLPDPGTQTSNNKTQNKKTKLRKNHTAERAVGEMGGAYL